MSAPSTDRAAVAQIIKALQAAGWVLDHVYDGEDKIPTRKVEETIHAIFAVDDAYLHVKRADSAHMKNETGWVRFVLGNEPFEVASDYTMNLEDALKATFDAWDEE